MKLNETSLHQWVSDNGDLTHNLNYDLDENSIVMDLGGFSGVWVKQIIEKYNPYVYIVEPVEEFYEKLFNEFSTNEKVKLINVAVSSENKKGNMFLNGDATSSSLKSGQPVAVEYNTIDTILNKFNLDKIDLLQINIEGDEYDVLEYMLSSGVINKFKNIQVQFHLGVENDVSRRDKIRVEFILNGFTNKFNYPFVWESWQK